MLQCSLSIFPIPSSWRVSYIIYFILGHLDPTLVDHLSPYLSTCPIKHPLWLSVSCGSQDSTIQGSPQHKYGQKSSCSAFNAVVAVFPKIFLSSHLLCMLTMHVFITGASWKITLISEMYIWTGFIMSEEKILPRTILTHFCLQYSKFVSPIVIYSSLDNSCPQPRPKAQWMFWAFNPIGIISKAI